MALWPSLPGRLGMSPLFKTILAATHARLAERKRLRPEAEQQRAAAHGPRVRPFEAALLAKPFSVIAEHKRRSPSGGAMDPANVARAYGVYRATPWIAALSVLTDQDHFGGSVEELATARLAVPDKPLLRKDFIVDSYQIYEARAFGADAILLMAALHAEKPAQLKALLDLTHELGMSALVEIGLGGSAPGELRTIVPSNATIWGINSRRFEGSVEAAAAGASVVDRTGRDPLTSLELHHELRSLIPPGKLAVAESGLHTGDDLRAARAANYRAALIGTAFLKVPNALDSAIENFGRAFSVSKGAEART